MKREGLDVFCAVLCSIRNDALHKVIPARPAPWEASLKECGYTPLEIEQASYVLAAFADDRAGSDLQAWSQGARSGWIWVLFHEVAAGVDYYERMDLAARSDDIAYLFFWLGLRAGFQGRYAEDADKLEEWLREKNYWDVPRALPQINVWPHDEKLLRMGTSYAWWQSALVVCVGLGGYGILVWIAERSL